MNKQQLMELAGRIHDGKATKEEKLSFLQALRSEFGEVENILTEAKKDDPQSWALKDKILIVTGKQKLILK